MPSEDDRFEDKVACGNCFWWDELDDSKYDFTCTNQKSEYYNQTTNICDVCRHFLKDEE